MAFQLSPGINVSEIDLTTAIPSVSTSAGGFAGVFAWGPANTVVTISDEVRLVDTFGKPTSDNYEYWFSAANFLAYSNNLKVVRAASPNTVNATANTTGLSIQNEDDYLDNHSTGLSSAYGTFAARYPGALGNSLAISICPSANAYAQNLTSSNAAISNAVAVGATVINYNPVGGGTANIQPVLTKGDYVSLDGGTTLHVVDSANGNTITIQTATAVSYTAGSPITRYWKYYNQVDGAPGTSSYASRQRGAGDEMHIVVIDEDAKFSKTANTVLERFAYVSKASDAKDSSGNSNYYKNVINSRSKYVWWLGHATGGTNWGNNATDLTFTNVINPIYTSLDGGSDGTIGVGQLQQAYAKFRNTEGVDVSLIIAGPSANTVDYIIQNVAEFRKDCVVFISPEKSDVVDAGGNETNNVVEYRNLLTSSEYAFMDSGWKYQYDKYNDVYRWVPLNADIAGLCVRTDSQRDPWFSPAGVNRGVIKNVVKLAWNPTKTDRDTLYAKSINPVVTLAGEGTTLYGDKTMLSRPSAFDRINVRRLFIALEKAIAKAARSSLFEFNDQFTRAQFVNLVEPYLRDVQGRRGITDFRVVCNETNNTAEVIDRNEFVGDIYIKPARSVNFIQLNFVATRTGVSFDEVVGRF